MSVDGSPGASTAISAAEKLAHATGAHVVVLRVVVPIPYYLVHDPQLLDPMWDAEAYLSARESVDELAQRFTEAGIPAEGRVELGQVSRTIVQTAEKVAADLLIMSTRALTGPARAILGSVADEVVRTARCPVLLVRQSTLEQTEQPLLIDSSHAH